MKSSEMLVSQKRQDTIKALKKYQRELHDLRKETERQLTKSELSKLVVSLEERMDNLGLACETGHPCLEGLTTAQQNSQLKKYVKFLKSSIHDSLQVIRIRDLQNKIRESEGTVYDLGGEPIRPPFIMDDVES